MLQCVELGLIIGPLIQAVPEDRLADLFGTRRADVAPRLVEGDAAGLEFEAAMIEDTAHAPIEIVDDILVLDAQHAAREAGVPMPHQIKIGAVVARDILDAVAEFLSPGEELLEAAATEHRAAGADYVIDSVADLWPVLEAISARIAAGEKPPA